MKLSYHYLMLLNYSAYQKQMYEKLSELNLSMGQPKILEFLYEHNGCMQKEIALGCQIEPASVTSILLKTEKEGYIVRRNENENRRTLHVYLTKKGLKTAEAVKSGMGMIEDKALEKLDEKEKEVLIELMKKVNLGLLGNTFIEGEE